MVYENARVFVEMMTGGHVRLLKAVPVTYQNIDVDAVVDQEERSRVDDADFFAGLAQVDPEGIGFIKKRCVGAFVTR